MSERAPLLSVEAAITLVVGLVVGLVPDMPWWLRTLGVVGTAVLATHTAKRMVGHIFVRISLPLITVLILIFGTQRSIWKGFQEDFPTVTGHMALAKIVEACALLASGIAGYVFLLRPSAKRGYRVLPAQIIAFGFFVTVFGIITVGIGLGWQFQQNWIAGTTPTGGSAQTFTLVPPQITQNLARALPPPAAQSPLFANYTFTETGISALADELFKIRDAVSKTIRLEHMGTDPSAGSLIGSFVRACDKAAIDCPLSPVHPNFPGERGILIYVADPDSPPEPAKSLRDALLTVGINVPFVKRNGIGKTDFSLFLGPAPE